MMDDCINSANDIKPPSLLYRLLSPLAFLFWLLHAIIHAYQFKTWRYIHQRLGFIPKPPKNSLWIHASSVGEVNLVQPLCEHLLVLGNQLTISTFTASGLQRAEVLFKNRACVTAIPMDCWPISVRFRAQLKPRCAIIAETELWPETLFQMAKIQIPLIHINARLSAKSLQTSKFVKTLLTTTLSYFSVHLCRYAEDIVHFEAMGVKTKQLKVVGNLKYASMVKDLKPQPNLISRPYILCASTHDDEELQLCSALLERSGTLPLIVIAPRHPKRSTAIFEALSQLLGSGNAIAVRSKKHTISPLTKVYLADTFGEMEVLMQHAELVIMGGSFVEVGGHNILEPAKLAKCIITGPSDSNIKHDIDALKAHHAIIQVNNTAELAKEIDALLNHSDKRLQMGKSAYEYCQKFQHILNKYSDHIERFIKH